MKLKLLRSYRGPYYTIVHLFINGSFFCDTIEDTDRGLTDSMPIEKIKSIKIYGETAIPTGIYRIDMSIVSNKFKNRSWAKCCNGKLPRLLGVKGFDGVLIHVGNTQNDSLGCILVGENKVKGRVINSTATFERLISKLKAAETKGEVIELEIV